MNGYSKDNGYSKRQNDRQEIEDGEGQSFQEGERPPQKEILRTGSGGAKDGQGGQNEPR